MCQDLLIRLGGLLIAMNILKVIGQHYEKSGLSDVPIESGLYSETIIRSILAGKQWNRALRCHKLVLEALWRLYWKKFTKWLSEAHVGSVGDVTDIARRIMSALEKNGIKLLLTTMEEHITNIDMLRPYMDTFDSEYATNPTFAFWRQYMSLVQVSLLFIRAEREGLWDLHLSTFQQILPWMAVYDHINHLGWGSVYSSDMQQLESTALDVHNGAITI